MQSLTDVLRLLDSIERRQSVDPGDPTLLALAGAVRANLVDEMPIKKSLGLTIRGSRKVITRAKRRRADFQLMMALRGAPVVETLAQRASIWKRCQVLAPLLARYAASTLPVDLRRGYAEGDWWRIWAFSAAQLGVKLPTNANTLYAVVQRHWRNYLKPDGVTMLRDAHNLLYPRCHAPSSESTSSAPSDSK